MFGTGAMQTWHKGRRNKDRGVQRRKVIESLGRIMKAKNMTVNAKKK